MKFSNFSVQNALFQRQKGYQPRDAAKKSQGSNCWRFSFQVAIASGWELLTSACDILCQKQRYTDAPAEGMMKPGFFEAHYSEPTVLDALVCDSHIWSVAWFIQMNIFSWSTGVKWTKERCLLSPTGECLRFSDPILYLTWCHYIGAAIPYIPCYTISYWSHILFLPSTGCNQWAQRQLPNLSAILGRDPKFPRGFCATKRQIYEKPLNNCRKHKSNIGQHR